MNTIALVTLFFPDSTVKNNITQLARLADKVVLLDNTPDKENPALFSEIKNAEYIAFNENLGLSAAFNRYLKTLQDNCYLVFFDQDSFCPENLISQLKIDYIFCCEKLNKKGIIGPAYFEKNSASLMLPRRKKSISENIYEVSSIITSGMFTELNVIKKSDFWNEDIFLDLADWDFCFRIVQNQMFCCLSSSAVLTHKLGNSVHRIAGIKLKEGASFRIYYQIRDSLYLMKKKYVPLKFKFRFILNLTLRPVLHLMFLPDKKKRLHYFFKGISDFKKNIHGSLQGEIK